VAAIEIDASQLVTLAADLGKASAEVTRRMPAAVDKGAQNLEKTMRADADKSRHFRFSQAINYDTRGGLGFYEAEIGPEKGSPGSIANIAYFGSSRGGGTVRDPSAALAEEAPRFEQAIADLANGVLW